MQNSPLEFKYKNWKGEVSHRRVLPIDVWYGETEFHKEKQWLLKAFDLDKEADRNFAMNDILVFFK